MSYNDDNERGGGYQRPGESSEYGGGGRGSDNYYGQSEGSGNDNRGEGRHQSGGGYNQGGAGYGSQGLGQGGYSGQGGDNYVSGGGGGYGGNYGSGGGGSGYSGGNEDQYSGAVHHATQHGSAEDESLFSKATSFLGQHHSRLQNDNIDESQAVNAHQAMYGGGSGGGQPASSQTVGMGAAMQALKMFTGQGGGQGQGGGLGGGAGGGQNQFIGMAMAQASKLFDQQAGQGNVESSASKQSAVTSAAEMAAKMYFKSQMGGGGSGASGLMGMASKFL